MKFTKMHGCGNDYVYVSRFEEKIENPAKLAVAVSNRHFGIGSDGLILICPSERADFRMEMYNADGSRGQMCGNGIRCLGKYVYDNGLTDKTRITVETPSGVKSLELRTCCGKVRSVRVDMGRPELEPAKIPVAIPGFCGDSVINERLMIEEETGAAELIFSALSVGNPHAVICMADVDSLKLEKVGPQIEHHPYFPERVNAEFIEIFDKENIKLRVWERGSGETLACGTGACAAAVIGFINGWTQRNVTVHLPGGELEIEYAENEEIYMTGPAEEVFSGQCTAIDGFTL